MRGCCASNMKAANLAAALKHANGKAKLTAVKGLRGAKTSMVN